MKQCGLLFQLRRTQKQIYKWNVILKVQFRQTNQSVVTCFSRTIKDYWPSLVFDFSPNLIWLASRLSSPSDVNETRKNEGGTRNIKRKMYRRPKAELYTHLENTDDDDAIVFKLIRISTRRTHDCTKQRRAFSPTKAKVTSTAAKVQQCLCAVDWERRKS